MSIKCGNCGDHHSSVADVRACCSMVVGSGPFPTVNGHDQLCYATEGGSCNCSFGETKVAYGFDPNSDGNSDTFESEYAPVAPTRPVYVEPVADGIYKLGDAFFKVVTAVHGSGKRYAKVLDVEVDPTGYATASWEYAPGEIKNLRAEHKVSEAEAAAFGKLYGICCICGRTLTNEDSIDRGIGPVCAGKQGW